MLRLLQNVGDIKFSDKLNTLIVRPSSQNFASKDIKLMYHMRENKVGSLSNDKVSPNCI